MNLYSILRPRALMLPALLMLLGIALVLPQQSFGQDADGRSAADIARRGAPSAVAAPRAPQDVLGPNGCRMDDCSNVEKRLEQESQFVGGSVANMPSFQIEPEAPINSLHIAKDGDLGLGTESPKGRIHVVDQENDIFLLDNNGNLELGGLLTEASSVFLKENFTPVDGQDVLQVLADLPISTWNYKTDDASVRHMGPVAQDFYAAFGLGQDAEHLAPLDANGVTMAALQAMYTRLIALEQQNAQLQAQLDAIQHGDQ